MSDGVKIAVAMFFFTLPILVMMIILAIIEHTWIPLLTYAFIWFLIGCVCAGMKVIGLWE